MFGPNIPISVFLSHLHPSTLRGASLLFIYFSYGGKRIYSHKGCTCIESGRLKRLLRLYQACVCVWFLEVFKSRCCAVYQCLFNVSLAFVCWDIICPIMMHHLCISNPLLTWALCALVCTWCVCNVLLGLCTSMGLCVYFLAFAVFHRPICRVVQS